MSDEFDLVSYSVSWSQEKDRDPILNVSDEYTGHHLPGGRLSLSLHEEWLATAGRDGQLTVRQLITLVRNHIAV